MKLLLSCVLFLITVQHALSIECYAEIKNKEEHRKRTEGVCLSGRDECVSGFYTINVPGKGDVKTSLWGCGYSPNCPQKACDELTANMKKLSSVMTMKECKIKCCDSNYCNHGFASVSNIVMIMTTVLAAILMY